MSLPRVAVLGPKERLPLALAHRALVILRVGDGVVRVAKSAQHEDLEPGDEWRIVPVTPLLHTETTTASPNKENQQ